MATRIISAVVRDKGVETGGDAWAPWWSYTNTALAAAALVLVSQGRLRLDEPLRARRFTLRHLLQHRAGLPDYGALAAYHKAVAAEPPWPAAELLRRVGADTLLFEPGQGWAYSNVGYLLVRELVEGAPLGPALERLVLEPLGITDAKVACSPADLDATAWGNAGSIMVGTATSAALLLHRLLAGQLLPPALLSAMRTPHPVGGPISGRPWQSAAYGLGLMIGARQPPACYVGHTGGGPGSTAAVYRRADEEESARSHCTAAALAPLDAPGAVERHAMALAYQG